jgi:phage gp36-like protein
MYATLEDLVTRFDIDELVQLTNSSGSGVINNEVAIAALEDASNIIDGYLGGRYTLPLSNVPKLLTKFCCDMARFNLYDNSVSDVVEKNNKAAIDFLKAVGKGDVRLGLSDTNQVPATDNTIVMESGGSVFNRRDSKGFI